MRGRLFRKAAAVGLPVSATLGGCGMLGAPSLYLFGAYFPAWMLCAVIGVAAAIAARLVFISTGLANSMPHQMLQCTSVGVIAALVVWLAAFGL